MLVSPVTQMVKNLPAMQETRVQSLGPEDPLEKGMATRSSTLLPGDTYQRGIFITLPEGESIAPLTVHQGVVVQLLSCV